MYINACQKTIKCDYFKSLFLALGLILFQCHHMWPFAAKNLIEFKIQEIFTIPKKNVQFLANTKIKSAVRSLLCIMWPTYHSYTFVKQTVIKINDYVGMILITANGDGNFRRRKIPVRRTLATNVGKIQILNSHSARVEYEMHKYIHTERKRWIDCCRASKHTHSTAMTSKRSRLYMFG